jgi:hypothetical protein
MPRLHPHCPAIRALLLLALGAIAGGCSLFDAERSIIMPVSLLEAPEAVALGEAFDVRIVGELTNGCQTFDRLDVDEGDTRAVLTMWGLEPEPPQVCTHDGRSVERT